MFLMTLTALKGIDKAFCRMSLSWDLSCVFSHDYIRLVGFCEEVNHVILRVHTITITFHC